jgi:hypothetical protein
MVASLPRLGGVEAFVFQPRTLLSPPVRLPDDVEDIADQGDCSYRRLQ